eukprot:1412870-Prymnesium_polylepis.1
MPTKRGRLSAPQASHAAEPNNCQLALSEDPRVDRVPAFCKCVCGAPACFAGTWWPCGAVGVYGGRPAETAEERAAPW